MKWISTKSLRGCEVRDTEETVEVSEPALVGLFSLVEPGLVAHGTEPMTQSNATERAALLQHRLGISAHAADLFAHADVLDLHIESFSFYRSLGYDPTRPHGPSPWGALLVGQADVPRLRATGIDAATWVITANPLRPSQDRSEVFARLWSELHGLLDREGGDSAIVSTVSEYREAKQKAKHACFLGVQGANAFPPHPDALAPYASKLLRITLLHMNDTAWGATSAPSLHWSGTRLGRLGYEFVEAMNSLRIGVDLAHLHPDGFWDALGVHAPHLPALVTHTGVCGAHEHWRNLDDAQLRAIAQTGGTVGIMYHALYLGDPLFSGTLASVVRHILHALKVAGEDHVSLGSDWDGLICTPRDMPTCEELPKLADALCKQGVRDEVIVKILGGNALRVIELLKGG